MFDPTQSAASTTIIGSHLNIDRIKKKRKHGLLIQKYCGIVGSTWIDGSTKIIGSSNQAIDQKEYQTAKL